MKFNEKIEIGGIQIPVGPIYIVIIGVIGLFILSVMLNRGNNVDTVQKKAPTKIEEQAGKTLQEIEEKSEYNDGISKDDVKPDQDIKDAIDQVTPTTAQDDKEQALYKISQPYADPYAELDKLIGLGSVKEEVRSMVNYIKVQEARKKQGLATKDVAYHMVFTGNPGTGKTTVARIMASILKDLGVLKKGHTVETDRSGLVAEYVGQTGPKTNNLIDKALDGVLFIDEAYALMQSSGKDYGDEAIAALLKRMEDDRDRLVVIIAGYTKEMNGLLESNSGLKSRFNRYIEFPDYSAGDLCGIFKSFTKSGGYTLDAGAEKLLAERMNYAVSHKNRYFGNGRYARNVFERAIIIQADRLEKEGGADKMTKETLQTLTAADLQEAFNKVKN